MSESWWYRHSLASSSAVFPPRDSLLNKSHCGLRLRPVTAYTCSCGARSSAAERPDDRATVRQPRCPDTAPGLLPLGRPFSTRWTKTPGPGRSTTSAFTGRSTPPPSRATSFHSSKAGNCSPPESPSAAPRCASTWRSAARARRWTICGQSLDGTFGSRTFLALHERMMPPTRDGQEGPIRNWKVRPNAIQLRPEGKPQNLIIFMEPEKVPEVMRLFRGTLNETSRTGVWTGHRTHPLRQTALGIRQHPPLLRRQWAHGTHAREHPPASLWPRSNIDSRRALSRVSRVAQRRSCPCRRFDRRSRNVVLWDGLARISKVLSGVPTARSGTSGRNLPRTSEKTNVRESHFGQCNCQTLKA